MISVTSTSGIFPLYSTIPRGGERQNFPAFRFYSLISAETNIFSNSVNTSISRKKGHEEKNNEFHRKTLDFLIFFVYFFGGLECVGHSFAYVAHL
jgi:hypothetical protein